MEVVSILLLLLILFLLLLFLTAPRFSKRKAMKPFRKFDYAHRGYHNGILPENTCGAFENAKNHGYGMELDVQLTKDEELIVLHDFSLLRAAGIDKQVDQCTYEKIKNLKVFDSEAEIPTFEEVLKLIDGQVPLIIEIKQKGMDCKVCAKTWKYLRHYQHDYVVESFNPMAMMWFKQNHPEVLRGQLSCSYDDDKTMNPILKFCLKNLLTNFLSRPDFIAYKVNERSNLINQLHCHLFHTQQVYWTVKDKQTYDQVKNDENIIIFENFSL